MLLVDRHQGDGVAFGVQADDRCTDVPDRVGQDPAGVGRALDAVAQSRHHDHDRAGDVDADLAKVGGGLGSVALVRDEADRLVGDVEPRRPAAFAAGFVEGSDGTQFGHRVDDVGLPLRPIPAYDEEPAGDPALGTRPDAEHAVVDWSALVGDLCHCRKVSGRHRHLGDGVDVVVAELAARGHDLATGRGHHPAGHPRLAGDLRHDLVEGLPLGDLGKQLPLPDQRRGESGDPVLGVRSGDVLGHVDERDVCRDRQQRQAVRAAGVDDVFGDVAEQALAGDQRCDVGIVQQLDERLAVAGIASPHQASHHDQAWTEVARRVGEIGGVGPADRALEHGVVGVQRPDPELRSVDEIPQVHGDSLPLAVTVHEDLSGVPCRNLQRVAGCRTSQVR